MYMYKQMIVKLFKTQRVSYPTYNIKWISLEKDKQKKYLFQLVLYQVLCILKFLLFLPIFIISFKMSYFYQVFLKSYFFHCQQIILLFFTHFIQLLGYFFMINFMVIHRLDLYRLVIYFYFKQPFNFIKPFYSYFILLLYSCLSLSYLLFF